MVVTVIEGLRAEGTRERRGMMDGLERVDRGGVGQAGQVQKSSTENTRNTDFISWEQCLD